jgi:hypothetical protein
MREDLPTRTPKVFIEDRNRNLASTSTLTANGRGNPKNARGPPPPNVLGGIEPAFLSIAATAVFMAESVWTTKNKLRLGIYRGKKSGRRTLIEFPSVKAHAAALPVARFAPPRHRRDLPNELTTS